MVWMEDNICIYRYGEILHTSAVLVGTIHVIQGIYINWREPAFSSVVCKQKVWGYSFKSDHDGKYEDNYFLS